jgi:uncharacterized membrane protein YfcA
MDPILALAGFGVGVVVGLTGMGGGALMTPMLVLFFNVPPLAAVSSDLAASAVMKPFGGFVHARRGTVNWALVRWLCLGSVPAAFLGVLVMRALGDADSVQTIVQYALAGVVRVALVAVLLASAAKLLGAPGWVVITVPAAVVLGATAQALGKRRRGRPVARELEELPAENRISSGASPSGATSWV